MEKYEFEKIVKTRWELLGPEEIKRVVEFREKVVSENKRQNLTRLIAPQEFYEGHVIDVKELIESGFLEYPALDMGSGLGVPGLLSALIEQGDWVLAESEGHKATFLRRLVQEFQLKKVVVFSGRAEDFLSQNAVNSVVARAVAPVSKILKWMGRCSTWNKLILFKGKNWDKEWGDFQKLEKSKEYAIVNQHEYSVGPEDKERRVVVIQRKLS